MPTIAEIENGQKITFQRYIEETYADAKPQFIDNTKYDSVHGIDKAFVMNNHLHLCIAEVKSHYSQRGKDKNGIEQMSKQWIMEQLQKLQQQDPAKTRKQVTSGFFSDRYH